MISDFLPLLSHVTNSHLKVRLHKRQKFCFSGSPQPPQGLVDFSSIKKKKKKTQTEAQALFQALPVQHLLPSRVTKNDLPVTLNQLSRSQTRAAVLQEPDANSRPLWGLSHLRFKDLLGFCHCWLCRRRHGYNSTFVPQSVTDSGVKQRPGAALYWSPSAEMPSPCSFV